ncbi:ISL3 family transposase [Nonomuraea sp. NPDC049709]|uniref:ISL3 family transposase n=1 Tax=Nonomuraea sp. NPDC049709 TaxID=3154736 RepID=UPI003433455E
MIDATVLVSTVFAGLSPLIVQDVTDEDRAIRLRMRTPDHPGACPDCGTTTSRVHGYHQRIVADVAVDARPVVLEVRVRRLVCATAGCRRTFREQIPGLLRRYQRRTVRLATQVAAVVKELAGRAAARTLQVMAIPVTRFTALRMLLALPLPLAAAPRVLGVDDFALRKGDVYATILIDVETNQRIDVLPGRKAETLTDWLRAHPGVEVVCRDGSTTYAQAIRDALPDAVQVSDRWHLWNGLGETVRKEVGAHSSCWAQHGPPLQDGKRAATTLERWRQVHELIDAGVGLLETARRLQLALNTVKRYARASEPERMRRAPQYRPTLVDPSRDHLRARRAEEPAIPVQTLLTEIKKLGYTGSQNLLYRYINQGRVEADRPTISAKRVTRLLLSNPDKLTDADRELAERLSSSCVEMTVLVTAIRDFAAQLKPDPKNDERLDTWILMVRAADLPHLHSFCTGLDQDRAAVEAGLTLPHHNGGTEGVNNKTKMIKRQMYGRAGFRLLRHRILLG